MSGIDEKKQLIPLLYCSGGETEQIMEDSEKNKSRTGYWNLLRNDKYYYLISSTTITNY